MWQYHIYHVPQPYGRYYQPSIGYYNDFRQITVQEAIYIALGRVPGQALKVVLDQENGMWVYEVDIITPQGIQYGVDVDINTGAIVKVADDRKAKNNQSERDKYALKDTKEFHSINSKKYTRKRRLLHKRIVSMIETPDSSPKKGHKPIAVLIGGGTASGKTTMRKRMIEKELNSKLIRTTVVDFDDIKEYIPEYSVYKKKDINQAATLVHKESYDTGALLLDKLIKEKKTLFLKEQWQGLGDISLLSTS